MRIPIRYQLVYSQFLSQFPHTIGGLTENSLINMWVLHKAFLYSALCSRMDHVVYYKVFISLEGSSYTHSVQGVSSECEFSGV